MSLRLKLFILSAITALSSLLIFSPSVAQAALFSGAKGEACSGAALQATAHSCSSTSGTTLNKIIKVALDLLSIVVGIISVVMIIVGGIKYSLSQGDSAQTNSAKNTVLFAIVGLVIVGLAQVIVKFVLNKLTTSP